MEARYTPRNRPESGGVMESKQPRRYYCRCGTRLARDNTEYQCARCQHLSRDKLIAPPKVSPEFWHTEQFREAFAAQHMGWVSRAYRTHPYHHAVYGPGGISQTLLGQWVGLRQPHLSRFETGPPTQPLDTLRHWARVLRIPPELLWFDMPGHKRQPRTAGSPTPELLAPASNGRLTLPAMQSTGAGPASQPEHEPIDDPERDPLLVAAWNHQGTVDAVVQLSGGDQVKRRAFLSLTGTALTAPAHQWLVREPGPLVSGLSGGQISGQLVTQISAVVAELRRMDDVGGGGSVLATAEQLFANVARLLNRASYDDATGRALHIVLADLGQFCGWSAYDIGEYGLAQRYYIAGLRAAHTADDRPLGAHILATMANQATKQGQPGEAVTLIDTALAGVRGWTTPALLAELHLRHAQAAAALCDKSACTAAISRARTHVEQLKPDDDPAWLYWLDPAAIAVNAGTCMLELGLPDQAIVLLDEGITQFSASFVRDRQIYLVAQAEARALPGRQHDLEAAARLGMQSIDLAESLDSTTGLGRLRDLCFRMKPYSQVPTAREFLERAKEICGG
jgi:hypothetical protein